MGAIHQAILRAMEAVSEQTSVDDVVRIALGHAVQLSGAVAGVLALRRGSELVAVAELEPSSDRREGDERGRVALLAETPLSEVSGIPAGRIAEAAMAGSDEVFDMVFGAGDDGEPVLRPKALCVTGVGKGDVAAAIYLENQHSGCRPEATPRFAAWPGIRRS